MRYLLHLTKNLHNDCFDLSNEGEGDRMIWFNQNEIQFINPTPEISKTLEDMVMKVKVGNMVLKNLISHGPLMGEPSILV